MLKKILKKIFPLLFLRRIALTVNGIKIKFYYPFIFPKIEASQEEILLERKINPFLAMALPLQHLPEEVKNRFRLWNDKDWMQDEYIVKSSSTLHIDPTYGWAVTDSRKLYAPSLGFSDVPYLRRPSLKGFLNKERNEKYFDKAISFRDTGEENYFHFFNDVLAKFFFLKKNNLLSVDIPLIISENLARKEYFKYFLEHTYLKEYNWQVQQEDAYIKVKDCLFCKPMTHSQYIYDELVELLGVNEENHKENKRIFLVRSSNSLRYIENQSEIDDLLIQYGFQCIETSTLKFKQQVELFSKTRHLIGVHGAGLSNLIFRKNGKMDLLEIFSPYPALAPFHYIMLSDMCGFSYNAMLASPGKDKLKGGFRMEVSQLKKYLQSIKE